MECTGYWETCKCEDCKYAATLYEELEYYNNDPDFEPEIKEIENTMLKYNALGSMMSGSGPTVFGLFDSEEDALNGKVELLKKYSQVYIVRSSEKGVEIYG